MKKILAVVLALSLLLVPTAAMADDLIKVTVDGEALEFATEPVNIDGTTMVPMRKIFEALGAEVEWIGEMQLIIATKGSKLMVLGIGSNEMSITDLEAGDTASATKAVPLTVAPYLKDGNTMVPTRAVSEAFDKTVEWDGETHTVIIKD